MNAENANKQDNGLLNTHTISSNNTKCSTTEVKRFYRLHSRLHVLCVIVVMSFKFYSDFTDIAKKRLISFYIPFSINLFTSLSVGSFSFVMFN